MARPPSPTLRREAIVLAILIALAAVLFWTTRLDLAAADAFRTPCCSWPIAERQPWSFVYKYGVFAGVLLAAAALVVLTVSYWSPRRWFPLRRPALYLVLVVALGPGLMVNLVLKDHFGRPRPRDVVELGGREPFLPVGVPGTDRQAKSFPCGHCSMGFYLGVPYLVLRRRRRRAAWAFMGLGLAAGAALGLARMAAGGHFLSDVIASGGVVWLVALALHRLMDLDREPAPAPEDPARDRRKARWVTAASGGALALVTGAALLATPYVSSKTFARTAAQVAASPAPTWQVSLDEATVSVAAGADFVASYTVRAFGFPTSKVRFAFAEGAEAAGLGIERMGWFTERRTTFALTLPASGPRPVRLRVGKGKVDLDLRGFAPSAPLDVEVGEGEVRVLGAAALARPSVHVAVGRGSVIRE
jgi:membrane-associated PAP2 superfamily phosphatase